MPAQALILAAGRGARLRPFTDHTPKPLLPVRGRRLIEWHLLALAAAGVHEVVVNTAWLEAQFPAALGDGKRYGLRLHYSHEGRDHGGALETGGGIATALPLLDTSFWVVSGDVFLPGFAFDAAQLQSFRQRLTSAGTVAHLWLVPNAAHHPQGDFGLAPDGLALAAHETAQRLTWASVGLFHRAFFDGVAPGTALPLRPLLDRAIAARRVTAERWHGDWTDVGTPERLAALNAPAAG